MKYDPSITKIEYLEQEVDLAFSLIENRLPENLNLHFIKGKKEVKSIDFLPIEADDFYGKPDNYLYGYNCILDYSLILYSNEYLPWKTGDEVHYSKKEGFLLVSEDNKIISYLKVFDSELDSSHFLRSFLYDNFIIILQSINHSYDVIEEGKEPEIDYCFVVVEVTKKGEMQVMAEEKGKAIVRKYLSNDKQFKKI
ncbi:hypothetical protein [Sinomicrobium oceani]|uniref:hypothetical protein n=1 Tax=Sinomicrobium oceani TaxID=1150368 RepID=UPI00227D41C7|nr:hypothetical protein [Sinomicrobium oceani]